jgi:hypothetical protein
LLDANLGAESRIGQEVTMDIPYSAEKDDLYSPAKRAQFFPHGRPRSDAALCVEMARLAYSRQELSFALDQPRINKILGSIKFTGCKFFDSMTPPHGRGTHGFLALDENAKLALLAFRGTDADDPSDISDDFNAMPEDWQAGGKVHSGFSEALSEIWGGERGVEAELAEINGYRLLFTGHSLGAAMATLAASLRTPASLYTFGSPRVGDADFVAVLETKQLDNHRYVDCCDLVARVPPDKLLGYAHIGRPYYIDLDRAIQQRDPDDPYIGQDQAKAELLYIEQYAWRTGDVALRPLADHAPVNYVLPVTAATP